MKTLLLLAALAAPLAHADDAAYQPECLAQAQAATAKLSKTTPAALALFNAALVGDGVDALETITLRVEGKHGLYVVTMEYDDCSVFSAPKYLNN